MGLIWVCNSYQFDMMLLMYCIAGKYVNLDAGSLAMLFCFPPSFGEMNALGLMLWSDPLCGM